MAKLGKQKAGKEFTPSSSLLGPPFNRVGEKRETRDFLHAPLMYLILFASVFTAAWAWDVAAPPMGYNTWNYYHCGTSAAVLNNTAQTMHDNGLQAAGYMYVNTDDCWMNAARGPNGEQVANPSKFPNGFKAVADFIHSLGLKSGLYTAKGPNTCAKFAASCDHEIQDAAQWAAWGVDYVKDDSCSVCPGYTDTQIYGRMWQAIQDSGRPMVLTVEGNPIDSIITLGGYGNAKRVGHDISPNWNSMTSLVDIGSGLWMFAHNSTNATYGGWWNDLDMIEVGNGQDFACGFNASALARCQAHFTMWTLMKAPLILGNNLMEMDAATLSVLTNAEAIGINQDALGVQAQRVASTPPPTTTSPLTPGFTAAVLAPCDATRPTQTWFTHPTYATLATRDTQGREWCLHDSLGVGGTPGSWGVVPCGEGEGSQSSITVEAVEAGAGSPPLLLLRTPEGAPLGWDNSWGASGPLPHTRYLTATATAEESQWVGEVGVKGGSLQAHTPWVYDDDAIGGGSQASTRPFCLDATADGQLEVWGGPLTGGRFAVALFNRAAVDAPITATFSTFNATGTFKVRDVWAGADKGSFSGTYTATVASRATAYLILTPA